MKFFFQSFIKKKITIKILNGYKKLKKNDRLNLFVNINRDLTNKIIKVNDDKFFFIKNFENTNELSIRQYLITQLGGYRLQKSILFFHGIGKSLCYPLCPEWIEVIERNSIKVNKFLSFILWKVFLIYKLLKSTFFIIRIFIYNFRNNKDVPFSFFYFYDLNKTNIPNQDLNYSNFGIFEFVNKIEKANNKFFFHGIKNKSYVNSDISIQYLDFFFQPCGNLIYNLKIFYNYFFLFFLSLYGIFFSWKYPFFINELIKLKIVQNIDTKNLPKKVFFNQSSHIYKPYWTYFTDKKDIDSIFYFYSTNIIEITNKKSVNITDFLGWNCISWNNFYFWDRYQKEYIHKFLPKFKYKITGPINFLPLLNVSPKVHLKDYICLFDIRPPRMSFYSYLGKPFEFYIHKNMKKFISDIYALACELNLNIIIKQKRKILKNEKNLEDKRYLNFINSISENNNIKIINDEDKINLYDLIKKSVLTISVPFTSTAVISKFLNKNCIFYDPTGEINFNQYANHGITTINSESSLREYLYNLKR